MLPPHTKGPGLALTKSPGLSLPQRRGSRGGRPGPMQALGLAFFSTPSRAEPRACPAALSITASAPPPARASSQPETWPAATSFQEVRRVSCPLPLSPVTQLAALTRWLVCSPSSLPRNRALPAPRRDSHWKSPKGRLGQAEGAGRGGEGHARPKQVSAAPEKPRVNGATLPRWDSMLKKSWACSLAGH